MTAGRAGLVLLEVIAALAILAIAGVSALALASQSFRVVGHAFETERELREASAFFDAATLWPREDLDRRLGDRPQGPWRLRIARPHPTLYTLVLADSATGAEILRTSVHRQLARSGVMGDADSDVR